MTIYSQLCHIQMFMLFAWIFFLSYPRLWKIFFICLCVVWRISYTFASQYFIENR